MDPITMGISIVGMGMSLFGGMGAASEARKQAEISQKIGQEETKINEQKRQQMMLSAQRQQMENFRATQRARALGVATAANQGAMFSSSFMGGQAQAQDQGDLNNLGLSQNLEIGQNIFSLNNNISGLKGQMAQSQGRQATDQGLQQMGNSLFQSSEKLGRMGNTAMAWIN